MYRVAFNGEFRTVGLGWVTDLGLSLHPDTGTLSELENFIRLRHCFAHEYGRATQRNIQSLKDYRKQLEAGNVLDERGKAIAPYFDIGTNDEISLTNEAPNRLRLTLWCVIEEIDKAM